MILQLESGGKLVKRTLILLLAILIIFTGCSNNNETVDSTKDSSAEAQQAKRIEAKGENKAQEVVNNEQPEKSSKPEEILTCKKDDPENQENKLPQDTGFIDPFNNVKLEEGNVTIGNENFNFKFIKEANYENTAATLIGSSENYLLFHNYNGVLSYYDKKIPKKFVIDEHINIASISPDERYIIYTKNAIKKEAFYYLDLETFEKNEFDIYLHDNHMEAIDMAIKDGLVYFIVKETDSGKTSIHYTALPSYVDNYSKTERNSSIDINADKLFLFNNDVFAFNKDKDSFEKIIPNNPTESFIKITSEDVTELFGFDYADDSNWVIGVKTKQDESVIITPSEKVKCYEAAMKTTLFDDNFLLINDNLSLYLFDLTNNESSLIKSDITDYFVIKNRIIIQTNNGEFLELSNGQL